MGMCAELPLMDVCEKGHLWAVFFCGSSFFVVDVWYHLLLGGSLI